MLVRLKPMTAELLGALALVLAVLAGAARSNAAPGDHDFTGQVPGIARKTWIDLLSQIFPGIAVAPLGFATAREVIDLRSVGAGDDSWIKCGDAINCATGMRDRSALAARDYTIVTVMIEDECVGPIALFDDKGKLVDAVNIRGDQHVSFSGEYVRPLGPDGALVTASLWHDNSSQSYDISSLILARPEGAFLYWRCAGIRQPRLPRSIHRKNKDRPDGQRPDDPDRRRHYAAHGEICG